MLVALTIIAPLAHGSREPMAVTTLEVAEFGLAALWLVKVAILGHGFELLSRVKVYPPLAALSGIIGLQLLPLPAAIIRTVSPMTYEVYSRSLPGWPSFAPFEAAPRSVPVDTPHGVDPAIGRMPEWHSLSLAPSTTAAASLKLLGCVAIFSVVLLYPLAPRTAEQSSERKFERLILLGLLTSGFLGSFIALVKWSRQTVLTAEAGGLARASGSYGNPDHFACFLTMILPLAVDAAAFGLSTTSRRVGPLRVFSGLTAFAMLAAVVLTGSRSGWAGVALELTVLLLLTRWSRRKSLVPGWRTMRWAMAATLICLLLFGFIGGRGQESVMQRLRESTADATLAGRIGIWKDSLSMVRDFPLVGVGLGCWSEFFPHFESPPWPRDSYWGETHNDYLQALCEFGAIGFIIIAWVLVRFFQDLVRSAQKAGTCGPLVVPVVAAVAGVGLEELFDFALQLPAYAFIFAMLLGLGLRIVHQSSSEIDRTQRARVPSLWSIIGFAAGIGLTFVWIERSADAVPHDPRILSRAQGLLRIHPADTDAHLSLLEQIGPLMSPQEFLHEVQRVIWLEPTNPYARDLYALVLLKKRDRSLGLTEVKKSVLFSPALDTHRFLFSDSSQLAQLPSDEKDAISAGLTDAMALSYQGAVHSLGDFYNAIGEPVRAAAAYRGAAATEYDPVQRSTFLIEAGISEIAANDLDRAQIDFEKAVSVTPKRAEPYKQLINLMFRKRDAGSAQKVADDAIKNNLDPLTFYVSLARGEADLGEFHSAEAVALKALNDHPQDPTVIRILGTIYLAESRYVDAAALLRQLCALQPDAADAFFSLGAAEERNYQYFAAEKAFQRAIALAPNNQDYMEHYNQFESNLLQNRSAEANTP
ncbi:MAG: O-antigen ligase family protein [Deltaproteobacteria bacterium]|nr:O-antigen ligase family protein [Deltaproteobacteria bacterium]